MGHTEGLAVGMRHLGQKCQQLQEQLRAESERGQDHELKLEFLNARLKALDDTQQELVQGGAMQEDSEKRRRELEELAQRCRCWRRSWVLWRWR